MILAEIIESSVQEDCYECLVDGKSVATVQYDWSNDGATQPWIVVIGDTIVHTANTQNRACHWVNWHLKQGTLPTDEPKVEVIKKECEAVGVTIQASEMVANTWIVLAPGNKTIGVVGFSSDGWWSLPISSQSNVPIRGKSCKAVIEKMILVEEVLSKPEIFVYQIVIDGAEENILRETREFASDAEAVKCARDKSRDYYGAVEIRVSKQVSPRKWVPVL